MMIHADMTKITLNHTSASRSDYYSFGCSVYGNRWEQMGSVTVIQTVVLNSLSSYLGPRIVTKIRGSEWEGDGTDLRRTCTSWLELYRHKDKEYCLFSLVSSGCLVGRVYAMVNKLMQ